MAPALFSIICWTGIAGLFYLDRDKKAPRPSLALLIPTVWLFLNSTRSLSAWLGVSGPNLAAANAAQAYAEGSPFDRNVIAFLQLAALAVLLARSSKVQGLLRKNVLILMYFSFCLASLIWSDFPFITLKRWVKALGDVEMVLVIVTESEPLAAVRCLLTRLGFFLFPLSILCIRYYPQIGRRATNSYTMEPTGLATQKNELGIMCMMWGVFFVWRFISAYRDREDPRRRGRLWAFGTMIAMSIYLLHLCNSTTSIVGFTLSAGVVWLASRPSRRVAVVHLAVLAVVGLTVVALFFNPGGGMVEALGKDPGLTGRSDAWKLLLGMKTNPLIGTGFESFWLGWRLDFVRSAYENFPINEAHNGYIEIYLNLGWAGLSFIALLLLTAYKRTMSHIRQAPEKGSLFLGLLLCAIFYSFSEAGFRFCTISWFFMLLIILAGSDATLLGGSRPAAPVGTGGMEAREEPAYAAFGGSLVS